MIRKTIYLALVSTFLMASAQAAPMLYGLSSGSPGTVYTVDPLTGAASVVVTTDDTSFVGATFLGGTFYGSDICGADCFSVNSIDLSTGVSTFVSDQDASSNWHGLASDEGAGLIYAIDIDDGNTLKSLTAGGVVTSIGTGTGIDGRGMAFDDGNGILYATDWATDSLYSVDVTTGTSTLLGSMGLGTFTIGLAFDELNGILYANASSQGGGTDSLYILDTTTGAASLVGANGFSGIDGLAWLAPVTVPEPGTLALLGLGLVGFGIARRKKT